MQDSVGKIDVVGKNIIENQGKKCIRELIHKCHLKLIKRCSLFSHILTVTK